MAEETGISWCDSTGRRLGAYKSAAAKVGCGLEEWLHRRQSGESHCYRCRTWKPTEEFQVDRTRGSGRASICKPCISDASTASRYGLTPLELSAFRSKHGNKCGICERTGGPLYVDHDHSSGRLRGLLCPGCNTAIGAFQEDPSLFAKALAYLEKNRG